MSGIDIRLPNINGKTSQEQIGQIKTYLYQFAQQLQWALGSVEAGSTAVQTVSGGTAAGARKEDTASNFNELKGLIIKSADIVDAFYEKIDGLLKTSGYYMAKSDFGTYKEQTKQQLDATHEAIVQNVEALQAIYDENGNIRAELLVNGHIYSGIIEYAKDGEAIVGIEIGQTTLEDGKETFNRFARFTADMLAFYDAANPTEPVAYISNYMLYITHAWVKGNLRIGPGFVFDTTDGLALRWVEEV